MEIIKKKCICGHECEKSQMIVKHTIITETVPLHDYNDLTPSRLIEYEEKRRLIYRYYCSNCNELLIEERGILF